MCQCFRRYQRSLSGTMLKTRWTDAEDAQLSALVRKLGDKDWQRIAAQLPGRTGQQCLHRYTRALDPGKVRGRWSPKEDALLVDAVNQVGGFVWTKIQKFVPGRTDAQCRERYCNVLSPEVRSAPWTTSEDERLEAAVREHGVGKWSRVARSLAGAAEDTQRTDSQCARRWSHLHPDNLEEHMASQRRKRRLVMTSFGGRKQEQPRLSDADLVSR